jgi:hypothetical protein
MHNEANLADGPRLLEKHTKRRKFANLIVNKNILDQGIDRAGGS